MSNAELIIVVLCCVLTFIFGSIVGSTFLLNDFHDTCLKVGTYTSANYAITCSVKDVK